MVHRGPCWPAQLSPSCLLLWGVLRTAWAEAITGPRSWVWGVCHQSFSGLPASVRLIRGSSLVSGVCIGLKKTTTTQLPVQILARGGCCESPSVATLGDVGHRLRGRAGGPWSPAALVSMGLSVSALGGWVAPKPGNWSVNSPHGPQRLDFLTPHLCHCANNARLQCPPSSPLPWPHLTSPAADHVLPGVSLLDLCRAWRARCKAASCVGHSP